jgi:Fe-S-cluster containining protein
MISNLPPIPDELKHKYQNLIKELSNSPKISDIEFIKKIYQYLDEYNIFVKTFTTCKQSCPYCCEIHVGITLIEAEYIKANNKRLKIDTKFLAPIKIYENLKSKKYDKKCPFLNSQNDCSIYKSRPFLCRTFHSLDGAEACKEKDVEHKIYGTQDPKSNALGKVNLGSDILTNLFIMLNFQNKRLDKRNIVKDIRDFFPSK